MNLVPFIADSAAEALEQIHAQLGPEAVVVSVRRRPAQGLARLWSAGSGIEVLALAPQQQPAPKPFAPSSLLGTPDPAPAEFFPQPSPFVPSPSVAATVGEPASPPGANSSSGAWLAPEADFPVPAAEWTGKEDRGRASHGWRSVALLEAMGLVRRNSERLLDALQARHGPAPPDPLAEELALTRAALTRFWRTPPALEGEVVGRPHVFVGPPGSGKTTVLCKWLTQSVLLEGRAARVWRLDGAGANTAEILSVYGEILRVPVERFWSDPGPVRPGRDPGGAEGEDRLRFIDLPGVEPQDGAALADLRERLRGFPSPHIHLVLNAAYEIPTLLGQARAFGVLPIHDLVCTHLDEEPRWAKLWNLVLGTNYSIRFLSGGQNIPGGFLTAAPEQLFPPQFQ